MTTNAIPRATGLLVIEVRNSNPNGDPDQESDPRHRGHDLRGMISPVSFKRKLRDLVDNKEGAVWQTLGADLDPEQFDIFEARRHGFATISSMVKDDFGTFLRRFWDARIFGNTVLEEKGGDSIRTGVAHFGLAVSVAPIRIHRLTQTKLAAAQADKSRGMAPLSYRVVEHAVYCMPFFINPTAAHRTNCTATDIELLLKLIPYAYPHTASVARPSVEVRHAWYAEHRSHLGSCSDFALIDALTPKRKDNPETPSTGWGDYEVPTDIGTLRERLASFRDLVDDA